MSTPFLFVSLLTIRLTISSCSFSIEAVAQTPIKYDTLDVASPNCDDSAIIVNSVNMSESLVVGTLKEGGLELYNLNGEVLQHIAAPLAPNSIADDNSTNEAGRFNNVDVIQSISDLSKSIIIVSDRGLDQLRFYTLNADKTLLQDITATDIPWVFSLSQSEVNKQETVYGLTATNYGDKMTAFVSKRHQGIVAKVDIMEVGDYINYEIKESLTLPITYNALIDGVGDWKQCTEEDGETPQVEGMTVDPDDGTLLISQEDIGLYKTSFDGFYDVNNLELIDTVNTFGVEYIRTWDESEEEYICEWNGNDLGLTGNIIADAEGLTLYVDNDDMVHGGYYILSAQGGNVYNIYSRNTFGYIGKFGIFIGNDTAEHTDGVEVRNGDFGDDYPEGIIVVQDDGGDDDTNFKFASFADVLNGIDECDEGISTTIYEPETTVIVDKTTMDKTDKGVIIKIKWIITFAVLCWVLL